MQFLQLFKRYLQRESHSWVKEDLISESQAESICQRYGINYHDTSQRSFGYYVLVTLGYLFIGLAMMTLIGENWDIIPRAVRMGGVIAVTLLINYFGYFHWTRNNTGASISLFFLGSIMFGVSIMLIAQIYHLGEHYPDGILWWILGVLPLAILLRSNVIMLLAMVLAFTWFFVETSLGYFPTWFPIFMAVLAWQLFYHKPNLILFLMLLVGSFLFVEYLHLWYTDKSYRLDPEIDIVFTGIALLVYYYALAHWMIHKGKGVFVNYGFVVQMLIVYGLIFLLAIFSFKWPWQELINESLVNSKATIALVMLILGSAIATAYAGSRSMTKITSTIGLSLVCMTALFAMEFLEDHKLGVIFQVISNITLVATGVGLVVQGIRYGFTSYFYTGVFAILLTGLMRYIDLVGDYIGATVLFIIFAIILLGTARFWKNYLMQQGESK